MSDHLKPTRADCNAVRAMTQARAAVREALTILQTDGDFWFASEHRMQNIDTDLAAMEMLFVDLYGSSAWAAAVSGVACDE